MKKLLEWVIAQRILKLTEIYNLPSDTQMKIRMRRSVIIALQFITE